MNCILVFEEYFHPDERLPSFLGQHMPWLRSGEQVRHTTLRKAKNTLAEQALTYGELAQLFLNL